MSWYLPPPALGEKLAPDGSLQVYTALPSSAPLGDLFGQAAAAGFTLKRARGFGACAGGGGGGRLWAEWAIEPWGRKGEISSGKTILAQVPGESCKSQGVPLPVRTNLQHLQAPSFECTEILSKWVGDGSFRRSNPVLGPI